MTTPPANRRLLVVDSDLSVAREVARRCSALGFDSYAANRSSQALEIYLQKLPGVVLVELLLPDGNGLDLIREIRTYDWSHASRIYLHAFLRGSVEVVRADARRAGANGLMPKPFTEEKLTGLVGPSEAAPDRSGLPLPEGPPLATDSANPPPSTPPEDERDKTRQVEPETDPPLVDLDADDTAFDLDAQNTRLELDLSADNELDAWLEGLAEGSNTRREASSLGDRSASATDSSVRPREQSQGSWTPHEGRIVTTDGALGRDTLLAILAAAWREDWFGRIRIESGRLWTEMAVGEGLLWTVTCDESGPSIVDVGFRHGLLAAKDLGRLSQALRERGERAAGRVLGEAGVTELGVKRILELTATERVMTAFESKDGAYRCRANLPPTGDSFEARLLLTHLLSLAVDRHVPVMRAVDRYSGREQEVLRKTDRFEAFLPTSASDRFSREAVTNLVDSETILDWIQRNPSNPGALFLLLTKLEEIGAVVIGSRSGPPAFSFGGEDRGNGMGTAITMPATPKQTSKKIAEVSDVPDLLSRPPTPPEQTPRPVAPLDIGLSNRADETPRPQGDEELVDDLEEAGLAASLHRLRTSGEVQAAVPEDESSGLELPWRSNVLRALDRWDWRGAQQELQARLIEAPEDAEAAAYEAWLAFARAAAGEGKLGTGDALSELEHVLEAAPSCPVTYLLLGLAAMTLGNTKQARAHFDAGLDVAREDPVLNVAAVLARSGYYDHPDAALDPPQVWKLLRKLSN